MRNIPSNAVKYSVTSEKQTWLACKHIQWSDLEKQAMHAERLPTSVVIMIEQANTQPERVIWQTHTYIFIHISLMKLNKW